MLSSVWELYMSCWGVVYDGFMRPKKSASGSGRSSVDDTTTGWHQQYETKIDMRTH